MRTGSRDDRLQSEDGPHQPAPPGTDQARHSQDLAPTDGQVRRPGSPFRLEAIELQDRFADRVRDMREEFVEVASDHVADDRRKGGVGQPALGDRTAVPEHGVSLGDPTDLFQEMADVDDRKPATPQPVDDREEPLGVAERERAGRLVEDDHPRPRNQGTGDLDQLLRPDAQVADSRLGPDVGMLEQVERLPDDPAMLAASDEPGSDLLLAEQDIRLDA